MASPASFLVLVEGGRSHRKRRRRPTTTNEEDAHQPQQQQQQQREEEEAEPSSPPGVLPPITGYEWVQVRETWGRLHLYRHAPRTYAVLQHPHHPLQTGGSGGEGQGRGSIGNGSRWRSASLSFSTGSGSGSGSGSGYFLGSGGRGGGLGAGTTQPEEEDGFYAPFRPARLSTVLLLVCRKSSSKSSSTSSIAEGVGGADSSSTTTPPATPTPTLSAMELLEGLSVIAPRIAFVHIVRDVARQDREGGSTIYTHALITLDSVEAAEGWVAMLEEDQISRDLSMGGQLVYASGVVMVNEPESDALLCCLKSLVDDVGSAAATAGTAESGNGSPEELSQLGTVQVQGPGGGRVGSAYCLAFGPPADALTLLSSLVLFVTKEGDREEEGEGEEGKKSGGGGESKKTATDSSSTGSSHESSSSSRSPIEEEEKDGGKSEGALTLFSQGLESYLAELPTCLQCLDRLDPIAIGVALGPSPLPGTAAAAAAATSFLGSSSSSSSGRKESSSSSSSDIDLSSLCATCQKVQIYALKHKRKGTFRSLERGREGGREGTTPTTTTSLTCNTCGIPENLWICLLCGHVGCGRYTAEHAKKHFHQSGHIFSLELATGRVWDYVEDVFVHSTQSQGGGGGGRRVATTAMGGERRGEEEEEEEDGEGEGGGEGRGDGREKGPQGKLDGLGAEYSVLLMSQLEEQNSYYERLLAKTAAELAQGACQDEEMTEEERKEAGQVRAHIARLEGEHSKLMEALREEEEMARQMRGRNQGLLHDQKQHMSHLASLRKAIGEAKMALDAEVTDLEAQICDLSFFLRTKKAVQKSELEGGGVVIGQSAAAAAPRGGRGGRRRKSGNK